MPKTYNHKDRYDVKRAGEKLLWRFKIDENGHTKNFKPNLDDLNALKCLLGYISNKKLENISNNTLAVKLFIMSYKEYIRKLDACVLDDKFNIYIASLLDKPLDFYYESFLSEFKTNQISKLTEYCVNKNQKSFTKEQLSRLYTDDFILNKLNETISNALENFSFT